MIYIEFIDRDGAMPVEIFRTLGKQASAWAEGAEDRMVLQLGRTLRLGPKPSYLCLWEIPEISRLDAWEAYFHSPAAFENRRSCAMHLAIRIERAGLYDVLRRGASLEAPLYVIHYCEPKALTDAELAEAYEGVAAASREISEIFLLRRIGQAGPDPALIAIWGAPSYVSLEPLLRESGPGAWNILDAGVYRPFGEEVL